ncbi:immunoglobulin-binding protein 1-like [Babylonia areolata]|uniref:immunoglobulin-binding protein 1-like n=1 Tax=Babylonia areolata TaxID=304850 RepID=UPI003FD2171E
MASSHTTEADETTLSSLFKSLWATHLMIEGSEESTGSDKIQGELRKALAKAEQAIFMVNQLHLFSDNEEIEEVATNEVKYMLLPALLGYFHALNTHASRLETVLKAKNHYKDFLRMCKSYKVTSAHIPVDPEEDLEETESAQDGPPPRPRGMDLQAMAMQRGSKIERFRQNKEYESRLKELSEAVERESVDDELKREFYLTQVKRWINRALDEIDSLTSEVDILRHMAKRKKEGKTDSHSDGAGDGAQKSADKKPFRPFILTKDSLQKQVFGLGYPGIPTMSIEEFYQQKVDDGTFSIPQSEPASQSLQGRALNPERAKQEEEGEEAERERRVEEDDPDLLQQARGMDEYKDDHRRGWGNRKNMG